MESLLSDWYSLRFQWRPFGNPPVRPLFRDVVPGGLCCKGRRKFFSTPRMRLLAKSSGTARSGRSSRRNAASAFRIFNPKSRTGTKAYGCPVRFRARLGGSAYAVQVEGRHRPVSSLYVLLLML